MSRGVACHTYGYMYVAGHERVNSLLCKFFASTKQTSLFRNNAAMTVVMEMQYSTYTVVSKNGLY
jgi:hypothetical protein